jgi:hypothetical protein
MRRGLCGRLLLWLDTASGKTGAVKKPPEGGQI